MHWRALGTYRSAIKRQFYSAVYQGIKPTVYTHMVLSTYIYTPGSVILYSEYIYTPGSLHTPHTLAAHGEQLVRGVPRRQ